MGRENMTTYMDKDRNIERDTETHKGLLIEADRRSYRATHRQTDTVLVCLYVCLSVVTDRPTDRPACLPCLSVCLLSVK